MTSSQSPRFGALVGGNPLTLTVDNLFYEVKVRDPTSTLPFYRKRPMVPKVIVDHVSLSAQPGRVLAIMGPSGSGKTSLLDLIVQRVGRINGKVEGSILINDIAVNKLGGLYRRLFGYITQEDEFMETLTVFETLKFAADLKLPRTFTVAQKLGRIETILQELGLQHARDTKVGGSLIRGISGGEKRRLSIGIQLICSPKIMLLDEPTSGLSATDALNVITAINAVAKSGITVIMTMHQPRSDIFDLFDDLLLLSKGKVVYFGLASEVREYFEALGHECPVGWNIADYLMDIVTANEGPQTGTDFAKDYQDYVKNNPRAKTNAFSSTGSSSTSVSKSGNNLEPEKQEIDQQQQPSTSTHIVELSGVSPIEKATSLPIDNIDPWTASSATDYATRFHYQTWCLLKRSTTNAIRHPIIFQAALVIHIVFGVMLGSVFSGLLDSEPAGIKYTSGMSLFFIQGFLGIMTFYSMASYVQERNLLKKERADNQYRTSAYLLARSLVDTVTFSIIAATFALITYWMIDFRGTLIYYVLALVTFTNTTASILSAIAMVVEGLEVGLIVQAFCHTIGLLFCGFVVRRLALAQGWVWLYWLSHYQYNLSGLFLNEFENPTPANTLTLNTFGLGGTHAISWMSKWNCLAVMVGMTVFFRCLAVIAAILHK